MKYIILTFTHGSVRAVIEANDYYTFGKRIPLPVSGAVPVTVVRQAHQPVEVTESLETADPLEATVASTSAATATGSATSQNRWLFSGKESQSFLSASIPLLDFGARMYDPTTARWTAQDPLAEKYYAVSPYAYCLGNPITFIDPNGESTWVKLADDGTYVVIEGGNAFDNDLNVYMTFVDENGHRQRGESIGKNRLSVFIL